MDAHLLSRDEDGTMIFDEFANGISADPLCQDFTSQLQSSFAKRQ